MLEQSTAEVLVSMKTAIATGLLLALVSQAGAGDPPDETLVLDGSGEKWKIRLTPYLWIPAQEGNVTLQGVPASVDLSIADTFDAITDNFNFALTLHAEFQRDDLTIFSDVMFLNLETKDVQLPMTTASVRSEMGIFELGLAYRVIDVEREPGSLGFALEPLAGTRAHYLSLEIDPQGAAARSGDEFWLDAIVGARAIVGLTDGLNLRLRGDIGAGGSDFTWSALAGLEVRLSEGALLEFGYRALDTDYSTGSGSNMFEYDVLLHGPYIGLTLRF